MFFAAQTHGEFKCDDTWQRTFLLVTVRLEKKIQATCVIVKTALLKVIILLM